MKIIKLFTRMAKVLNTGILKQNSKQGSGRDSDQGARGSGWDSDLRSKQLGKD